MKNSLQSGIIFLGILCLPGVQGYSQHLASAGSAPQKAFSQPGVLAKYAPFSLVYDNKSVAELTVKGRVTSEDGEPLIGVSVLEKGTNRGVITDINGDYSIQVTNENAILVFSYVGFTAREIPVRNASTLNVTLKAEVTALDEVVVIGYGTQRRADITGSVAIVDAEEMKKVATNDLAQMLQGRAAGVTVKSDGQPGAVPTVNIRGLSTFGNAQPLYVIDGVIVGTVPRDFNPNDIESMQVLKDASAGAIYGSRAANGVVIITTKQGRRNMPLQVEYNNYYGVDQVWQRFPVANRVTYQTLNNEARRNANQPLAPGNDPNSPVYINDIDTDWQREGLKLGNRTNHYLSLSGGGENTAYNVSLDYFGNQGTFVGNGPTYDRYTARINTTTEKGIFKFGQSLFYANSHENLLTYRGDIFLGARPPLINDLVMAIPTLGVYDATRDGGFAGTLSEVHDVISFNGIGANHLIKNYVDVDRMFGNAYGEVQFIKNSNHNLRYRLNLSYDRTVTRDFAFQPTFDLGYFFRQNVARLDDNSRSIGVGLVENTLSYDITAGRHSISLLAGQMFQSNKFLHRFGRAEGLTQPYKFVLDAGATTAAGGFEINNYIASYLGRVNYNFGDRYLLTGTLRRDASSRFAPGYRVGLFPSVAAGWRLSNESFFTVPKSAVTDLKIRGSWGQLGNENIGTYLFMATINPSVVYNFNGQRYMGATQTSVVDETIRWETKTMSNIGFDAVFLNGMFDLSAEYYDSRATDILVGAPIPASVGSINQAPIVNSGSLRNYGFEFVSTYHKMQGDFKFDISANFSTVRNQVLALGPNDEPIYGVGAKTEIGGEIGQHFGWVYDGIFQSDDEVRAHARQFPETAAGDIRFKDLNNDGVIDEDDRTYLGSAIPRFIYGLNFTANYKGFDFTMFASGMGKYLINGRLYRDMMHTGGSHNYHTDMIDRWTPENTNTTVPRLHVLDPNQNGRDSNRPGWLQDGTHLRLTTLSLGYTLPKNLIPFVERTRVFATAQNLYTFQRYQGYNPDFTSGILNPGFDNGSYPRPRTIMMGVQVGF